MHSTGMGPSKGTSAGVGREPSIKLKTSIVTANAVGHCSLVVIVQLLLNKTNLSRYNMSRGWQLN